MSEGFKILNEDDGVETQTPQISEQDASEGEQPQPQQEAFKGFGDALRRARELKAATDPYGWDIGSMVGRLHLSLKQVKALEEERVEDLPHPVYVRGFIKMYAKAVGIDPAPLVADYAARFDPDYERNSVKLAKLAATDDITEFKIEQPYAHGEHNHWRTALLCLILIAVGGGIAAWLSGNNALGGLLAKLGLGSSPEPQVTAPAAPTDKVAAPAANPAAAPAKTEPAKPATPEKANIIPDVTVSPDDGTPLANVRKGEVRITLTASDSAYVRISGVGNDKTYFEQELVPGATKTVRAPFPVRVILGNVPGLKVRINDTDYNVSEFVNKRSVTARFRLH